MGAVCVGVSLAACSVASAADSPCAITAGKDQVHLAFSPDGEALVIKFRRLPQLYDRAAWPRHHFSLLSRHSHGVGAF
jgi:hypothetical protein